ncbi:DNA glycosylase [Dendrothele bispora CBS 962.96]|uniref:Adenine DNA glycosylase n=1 Tax=Dendrothele bispora (strain CBS 962.96) TaxID=1314807 RepID=A0A4S8MVS1_DENBC|nr:DNA glycosylase [Dendrothele bispora CBS 962.96]
MVKRSRADSEDSDYDDAEYSTSASRAKTKTRPKVLNRKKTRLSPESLTTMTETDRSVVSRHKKSLHIIDPPSSSSIQTALLEWFETVRDARGMPWRKPFDENLGLEERAQRAYEVWVSEIMLQQTQVATVIPYYNAWMAKFPTIRELAAASIEDVNALWKGLGYYSRASRLLAGAQKVVKEYGGRLLDNAKDMEAHIPGIGRYSAGAICSIAYGERVPVLDGNVHRLLSRLLALHASPKAKPTLDVLWRAAEALVQDVGTVSSSSQVKSNSYHPGDINQALIELGSTVCKVKDPLCDSCPLRHRCHAYVFSTKSAQNSDIPDIEDACLLCEPISEGLNEVTVYPMKAERKKAREELDLVSVVEWQSNSDPEDRRFLLVKRPEKGLLAGLYEFITTPDISATTKADIVKLTSKQLSSIFGDSFGVLEFRKRSNSKEDEGAHDDACHVVDIVSAGDVVHVFSHIKKTYRTQWVVLQGGIAPPACFFNPVPEVAGKKKIGSKRAGAETSIVTQQSMWVPLGEVLKANIGTGVGKVWSLVEELWKNPQKQGRRN